MGTHLHQTVAIRGGYESLKRLDATAVTGLTEDELVSLMQGAGVEDPPSAISDFVAAGLVRRYGSSLGLTTFGIRTVLLLEALNGGDLRDVYHRLGQYDNTLRMYELVREGMTKQFVDNINKRPGFARLYFCSPWIGLDNRQQRVLAHALAYAERCGDHSELFVVTRPEGDNGHPPESVKPFRELGASIFLNRRLHTKLYIREPDRRGGYSMAIVGSQNLTRSRYLELGIRINADSPMINQLIAYFWDLCNASVEA